MWLFNALKMVRKNIGMAALSDRSILGLDVLH
jgi:hypothetical protein